MPSAVPVLARHAANTEQARATRTLPPMVPSISSSPLRGLTGIVNSLDVSCQAAVKGVIGLTAADDSEGSKRGIAKSMPCDLRRPDLAVVMPLDPHTPRSARHCVAQVDHPSPDLRDAVMLLCSEIVTQAGGSSEGGASEGRRGIPRHRVPLRLGVSPSR